VWGTGRRAGEANVTEGLGVDPPTPVDAWGAMAIGLLVYLILEANVKSRALYQRRKTHNSPDAESTLASLVTVKDADADENNNTDYGYGDGYGYGYKVSNKAKFTKAGESPRKQSQYMPPQAATGLKALARPIVAISPAQTYEAMQIGAALRRLDERKHQETTAIAKKLIPKLNAVQRHYEEEISQLDLRRAKCSDNATIRTIGAQKTKTERAHCAALGQLEADVRSPISLHLDNSQATRKLVSPHSACNTNILLMRRHPNVHRQHWHWRT
jgi:hypothetical protein